MQRMTALSYGLLLLLLAVGCVLPCCAYPEPPHRGAPGSRPQLKPEDTAGTAEVGEARERMTEFGILRVVGPVGRGLEHSAYEVCRETQEGQSTRREVVFLDDNLVARTETLRTQEWGMTEIRSGDHLEYRSHFSKRKFSATIDGTSIQHRHEDPFRGLVNSPDIPAQMESPRILDGEFLSSFQHLFQELLGPIPQGVTAEKRSTAIRGILDSMELTAISPRTLGMIRYEFSVLGRKDVEVFGGKSLSTTHIRVAQSRAGKDGQQVQAGALRREFWLLDDGTIVRMRAHGRKDHSTGYNLAYFPRSAGAHSDKIEFAGQTAFYTRGRSRARVKPGFSPSQGPAVLVLDEPWIRRGNTASSGFAHRVRWGLARVGIPSLGFGLAATEAGALATSEKMLVALQKRPEVAADQVFVLAYHGTLPLALRLAEKHGLRGVIVVDGEVKGDGPALPIVSEPPTRAIPVQFLWGPGSDAVRDTRTEIAREVASAPRFSGSQLTFPQVDASFWPRRDQKPDQPRRVEPKAIAAMAEFVAKHGVPADSR